MAAVTRHSFTDRIIGALRLDSALYEEVEADTTATLQAATVVILGAIAGGIVNGARLGFLSLLFVSLLGLASWSFYAWLAYFFGGTVLKGPQTKTDWGEIARTLGFANSPRILLVVAAVPGLAIIALLVGIWVIAATVVALRAALDVGTGRAIVVALISAVAQVALTAVLLSLQASGG